MKNLLMIMFVFAATFAVYATQNDSITPPEERSATLYLEGYQDGFKDGYISVKGPYGVPPLPGLTPFPARNLLTYKNGYIEGVRIGIWYAEKNKN